MVPAPCWSRRIRPGRRGTVLFTTGWGVGETHWGCLAQRARLNGDWLVALPEAFDARQAMAIGTAVLHRDAVCDGAAAARREAGDGEVLVTGATGGVGSVAIALLHQLGHTVVAATGKASEEAYLKALGATRIIDRAELSAAGKPMQKERWTARRRRRRIAHIGQRACTNAIWRDRGGVRAGTRHGLAWQHGAVHFAWRYLARHRLGHGAMVDRQAAWQRLAKDLDAKHLESITTEISLEQAIEKASELMAGEVRGRLVVRIPM